MFWFLNLRFLWRYRNYNIDEMNRLTGYFTTNEKED